jgi:hypothetical protein
MLSYRHHIVYVLVHATSNIYMYVCVCGSPTTRTHIWLGLNTKANENEKKGEMMEREGKKRFSFFSPEEGKWVVETETRKASTYAVGNKKQERKRDRMKNIYNITKFSTILQCQSVYRLDVREELKRKLLHD